MHVCMYAHKHTYGDVRFLRWENARASIRPIGLEVRFLLLLWSKLALLESHDFLNNEMIKVSNEHTSNSTKKEHHSDMIRYDVM